MISNSLLFRLSVMREIKKDLKAGTIDPNPLCAEFDSPEEYIMKMSRKGEYAEENFIAAMARHLRHDILVVYLHPESAANNMYNLYTGNCDDNCSIFLGFIFYTFHLSFLLLFRLF